METPDFLNPSCFWALLGGIPLALFFRYCLHLRAARLRMLGRGPSGSHLESFWLIGAVLALTIVALTRPYAGYEEIEQRSGGKDIMLLVDVSKSMLTADVSPNRMEFTRRKILDITRAVAKAGRADRVGIVLFAGEAYLFCPLTSDYTVVETFAGSISTELITRGGSALNQAVEVALNSLKSAKAREPLLLLISDGEDNQLDADMAIARLKKAEQPLHDLGVGTLEGRPIEVVKGQFIKDPMGNVVISKLNEEALKSLAERSGGKYSRASLDDSDFSPILALGRGKSAGGDNDPAAAVRKVRIYNELGPALLWIPLLIIIFACARDKRGVIFALALSLAPQSARAEEPPADPGTSAPASLNEAYRAYESGDFEAARAGFESALARSPGDPEILQALGSSLFKLGKGKEAAKFFGEGVSSARTGRQRFQLLYNHGNAYFQQEQYQIAIQKYEEALKIKPDDEPARFNLELAKLMLKKQEEKSSKDEGSAQSESDSESEQKSQSDKKSSDDQKSSQQKKDDSKSGGESKQDKDQKSGGGEKQDQKSESGENKGEKKQEDQSGSSDQMNDQKSEDRGKEQEEQSDSESDLEQEQAQPEQGKGDSGDSQKKPEGAEQSKNDQAGDAGQGKEGEGQPAGPKHSAAAPPVHDPKALRELEAKAWLDSMADSPVLMQRRTGRGGREEGQSW